MTQLSPKSGQPPVIRKPPVAEELKRLRELPPRSTNRELLSHLDSLAFCRKAGYRPELAWTCHDYADALLQKRGPGDRVKADALLDESLDISTELGMRPLKERVLALQEQAASQPARAPACPAGLSQREVEVLRLIAAGKTDREIADELVISGRTVNNQVRSILNITAVANRTEAATYAARQVQLHRKSGENRRCVPQPFQGPSDYRPHRARATKEQVRLGARILRC